ncbi:hypothetical protein JMJ35_003569 [Cladonia borealis]|uniref:GrpE protein homolog n=1 Tax=Cladonia borealis TaxID=184061 RepID=A0AA39R2R5_9LECA|nr:hypothetical protein JMJ35_003569 [Cladonia borealis]
MIQRSLLRQSRVASSSIRAQYKAPITRSHFPPVRIYQPLGATARRWQSTTTDSNGDANSAASTNGASSEAAKEEDPIKKELEAKNKEIIDIKDKYLRSVADFRNLQDRTKRDIDNARSFAITRFASDLIESVDNLDRALATAQATQLAESGSGTDANNDLENLLEGLKMTERILMQTLKKHGLERFDPSEKGERFDPNLHEATFQTRVEGKEDGSVFMTQQKGFLLNGRVIRAAKVGVVKNS